jgi:HEAT repeat protein
MSLPFATLRKLAGLMLLLAGLLALAGQLHGKPAPAATEVSQFQNARVSTQTLQGPLAEQIERWAAASTKPRWLGYAVTAVGSEHRICCSNYSNGSENYCGACALEENGRGIRINAPKTTLRSVKLEGAGEMAVMFRAEGGKLSRIRELSIDCPADAGGLDILWLDGVSSPESVAVLHNLVLKNASAEDYRESLQKSALAALALHVDASADHALQSFVSTDYPEWLRRETAFWFGEARGTEGLRMLQKMAHSDPSDEVRAQVSFALSISKEPAALTEMIRMAHDDNSLHVRGQALFWLAHKAGQKAEATITGAIENDPDTEVKKKAVFALSQMPKDEGLPKLIEVAQTNRNPEVRKQAMFWLGQSQDPRALAFFEKILAR